MTNSPTEVHKQLADEGFQYMSVIPERVKTVANLGESGSIVKAEPARFIPWAPYTNRVATRPSETAEAIAAQVEQHEGLVLDVPTSPTGMEYIHMSDVEPGSTYDGESRVLQVDPRKRFAEKLEAFNKLPATLRSAIDSGLLPILRYTTGASYRNKQVTDVGTVTVASNALGSNTPVSQELPGMRIIGLNDTLEYLLATEKPGAVSMFPEIAIPVKQITSYRSN